MCASISTTIHPLNLTVWGPVAEYSEDGNEHSSSVNVGISCPPKRLLACQERLCSIKLLSKESAQKNRSVRR